MTDILEVINSTLTEAGITYAYQEISEVTYPYWIGEYIETDVGTEDGRKAADVILTGFTRNTYAELEADRKRIENLFTFTGFRKVIDDHVVVIYYDNATSNVPTGDAELKKLEINLTAIKF